MNHTRPLEFAAFVGIDWADKKHDVCLQAAGSDQTEHQVLKHTPEAIDEWARQLRARFDGRPVAVCLELAKGPIVSALQKYDFLVLFPVNPNTLAKYREAWSPSGKKDDPTDALLALEIVVKHRDKLTQLRPQSPSMRALQQLVEDRRKIVDDRVRITNRMTAALKAYFPQVLEWFSDKGTQLFCDFLERWPSVQQAKAARVETLRAFFIEHNVRYADRIQQRMDAIKSAVPLTTDPGVVLPAQLRVRTLVAQLRAVLAAVSDYDAQIAELCHRIADYRIFAALPGAAEVFAPRLLCAFGEDRDRYRDAKELQRYAGVAPVTEQSGNSHWVHWRFKCPTFLRQSVVEWAAQTIPRSFWAGAFYAQQRARGASHQAALRALAFKWIRILFRCWQDRTLYDESKYLKCLQRRHAPLLRSAAISNPQS
jgi:transposase